MLRYDCALPSPAGLVDCYLLATLVSEQPPQADSWQASARTALCGEPARPPECASCSVRQQTALEAWYERSKTTLASLTRDSAAARSNLVRAFATVKRWHLVSQDRLFGQLAHVSACLSCLVHVHVLLEFMSVRPCALPHLHPHNPHPIPALSCGGTVMAPNAPRPWWTSVATRRTVDAKI